MVHKKTVNVTRFLQGLANQIHLKRLYFLRTSFSDPISNLICNQHKISDRMVYNTNMFEIFCRRQIFAPTLIFEGVFQQTDHAPSRESRFFVIILTCIFRK
jgi:hypothetical protein